MCSTGTYTFHIRARSATPRSCFGLAVLWLAASRSDRSHLASACLTHLIMRNNTVSKIMSKWKKKGRSNEEGILCLQNYSPTQLQFSYFHFHFEEREEPPWSPSTIGKKKLASSTNWRGKKQRAPKNGKSAPPSSPLFWSPKQQFSLLECSCIETPMQLDSTQTWVWCVDFWANLQLTEKVPSDPRSKLWKGGSLARWSQTRKVTFYLSAIQLDQDTWATLWKKSIRIGIS